MSKISIIIIIMALVLLAVFGLWRVMDGKKGGEQGQNVTDKGKYVRISAEEAKKRMDANPNAITVDVREPSEYAESHIKNAVLVPLGTIGMETLQILPDKNAEILIYCRSGRRSKAAANKFLELGYTNVYDFGGILSWPYEKE